MPLEFEDLYRMSGFRARYSVLVNKACILKLFVFLGLGVTVYAYLNRPRNEIK